MSIIKLQNINKIYRTEEIETVALENVNLNVEKGEFVSVMGPSGCGKSTLLNIVGLLDTPTSGTVTIADCDTTKLNDNSLAQFRNKTLGFVFQSFHLINSLSVQDNVILPLFYRSMSDSERREAVAIAESIVAYRYKRRGDSEIGELIAIIECICADGFKIRRYGDIGKSDTTRENICGKILCRRNVGFCQRRA